MRQHKADIVAAVCTSLADEDYHEAVAILEGEYPFAPELVTKRRFRPLDYTRVFIRDGFIDRYTGQKLVFPPVLRMISWVSAKR